MRRTLVAAGAVLLALPACEPRQLSLGARTVIGINAQFNPEQTTGSLLIGYDRTFAAIVPRSTTLAAAAGDPAPPPGRDAMAALVCSDLRVEGITIRRYTESMATGAAAQTFAANLAQNPGATRSFFDCFSAPPQSGSGGTGQP